MKTINNPGLEKFLEEREILPLLPATTLQNFLSLEKQLTEDQEMFAALVSSLNCSFLCLYISKVKNFKFLLHLIYFFFPF